MGDGQTWSSQIVIYAGLAAYASRSLWDNSDLDIFFEKEYYSQNTFVSISQDQILSLLN